MLSQRGSDLAREASRKADVRQNAAPPSRPPPASRQRLSFHEKHALETLPARIAALHAEVERLQRRLADPDLYTRDSKAFAETSSALTAAQEELGRAEETWLELEIRREAIEGA
jgi:ATP-binding cassette subfamily F protein uup